VKNTDTKKEENNPYDSPDYSMGGYTGAHRYNLPIKKKPLLLKFADDESNAKRDDDDYSVEEAKSSTERVRKYYRKHPEKVRRYLKSTVKDRVARNRDRKKAVDKYGEDKMKNHDVHHPGATRSGKWRLAKKDHGPDKKDGTPKPRVTVAKPKKKSMKKPSTSRKKVSRVKKTTARKQSSLKALSRIQQFVNYAADKLQLTDIPKISIIKPIPNMTSLGYYEPATKKIHVVIKNRLMADILRTIAHELVHRKQDEMGQLINPAKDGQTGSSIENKANSVAGILMRNYGQENSDIFLSEAKKESTEMDEIDELAEEIDFFDLVKEFEFKDTTKKAIAYAKHADIEEEAHLESMPPCTYATNKVKKLKVPTKSSDGNSVENIAEVGDIIMCGANNENSIITPEKFQKLYVPAAKARENVVIPEQSIRKIAQYTGPSEITLVSPWGEEMTLCQNDYVVQESKNGYYKIAKEEYESIYNPPGITKIKIEMPDQKDPIAIFPGRFQPFQTSDYVTYLRLVKEFGKNNVFISTSNKQDSAGKAPFAFEQKKKVMTKLFKIPDENIIETKNPFSPIEITQQFPENTPAVFAVSEMDSGRLGKYFKLYEDDAQLVGYRENGYAWHIPALNGRKVLTGTQVRHILGNPTYTERAKKEIFTKLYNAFDSEIFEMMVKVCEKSEQDRQITAQHKEKKERKRMEKDENANAKFISIFEEKNDAQLEVYSETRQLTEEELADLPTNYFDNEKTFKSFPDLAKSSDELTELVENADKSLLLREELEKLYNSELPLILRTGKSTEIIKELAKKDKEPVKSILLSIKGKEKLPYPVIIKFPKGYYLLSGNITMSCLAAMNQTIEVKLLIYDKPPVPPLQKGSISADKIAGGPEGEKKPYDKELFKRVLQMRITNPETGNMIKIDTAMDYKKTHPAHLIALNTIRQNMQGVSSRAGVAKNIKL
jgi:hypothetical protein